MKIIKAYEYLFYRIYILLVRLFSDRYGPEHSAYLYAGLLLSFNGFSLLIIVSAFFENKLVSFWFANKILVAIVAFLLVEVVSYFLFIKDQRWLDIINTFKKEAETNKKRKTKWVLGYVFATILGLILSMVLFL